MSRKADKDVISQAELRKGVEFTVGTSSAMRFVGELYLQSLERRLARGGMIEPGPLSFESGVGVVCRKKDAATETRVEMARLYWHSN